MKKFLTYRVNIVLAVAVMALVTYAAADLIIEFSTDSEIEYQYIVLESRVSTLEDQVGAQE